MRKITILLMSCIIMVSVSCSKNNENSDENRDKNEITNNRDGKKLISKLIYDCIDCNDYNEYDFEITFNYDSEGCIKETNRIKTSNNKRYTTIITKDNNRVTCTYINSENQEKDYSSYILNDRGVAIKEETYETHTYSYDDSQHLKGVYTPSTSFTFTWEKDNIISRKIWSGPNSVITKYNYYPYPNDINIDFTENFWGACRMDTYFGKTNKNLLKSIIWSSYSTDEYEYEFNGDKISTVKKYNRSTLFDEETRKLVGTYYLHYK